MFGNKKTVNMMEEDQARIENTCGFVESLVKQIETSKADSIALKEEISEKITFYTDQLKRLKELEEKCAMLLKAGHVEPL